MFSVNFAKFVRKRFIKKTARILEINKDLQRTTKKIKLKMKLKIFYGKPGYFIGKHQSILRRK